VEEDEVGGTCGTNGVEEERAYVIVRTSRGKETTRKTTTEVDNIEMNLSEIGLNVVNRIRLAQDRHRWRALMNTVLNFQVP
jgi:hypothetical protein